MYIVETILEILKYTIPALIVYYIIRQFLKTQWQIEEIKRRSSLKNDTLGIRLQAYERLVLFCDRIRLANLVVRLKVEGMSTKDMKNAMMIAVQKEFEHNLSQQIYVSAQLWEMLELLKDETLSVISTLYVKHEHDPLPKFSAALLSSDKEYDQGFTQKVKAAIRKEIEIFFQ